MRSRARGVLLAGCAALWLALTPGAGAGQPGDAPLGSPGAAVETQLQAAVPTAATFAEWLDGVRLEALERGIRPATVDAAFEGLEPLAVVLERDRAQTEFTLTLDGYIRRRLTAAKIRDARREYARERALLARITDAYGVPGSIVTAIWALESNFGRFTGVRPTIAALATLGWDGRRGAFFRRELIDALTIVDRGDIELAALKGSWAGAMGQPQFMPSSYLRFAQDFDGDGRKDIWTSRPDIFASIAAYLQAHGWDSRYRWGREVTLPSDMRAITAAAPLRGEGCAARRGMTVPLPLSRWQELGVRVPGGGRLPAVSIDASLVRGETRHFLVYGNYEALLSYNCAHAYALSVGLLADRLGP